jgi:glycosyltransferase involved in cell wall biosynthesis
MKKILVFVGGYIPGSKYGGPISSVFNLVEALKSDIRFKIVTRDRDLGDRKSFASTSPEKWNIVKNQNIFYSQSTHKSIFKIYRLILEEKPDLIYLNSIFSLGFGVFPILAIYFLRKINKPRVLVAPRSELLTSVMKPKYFRKTIYLHLIKMFGIYKGVEWQATSELERKSIETIFHPAYIHLLKNIPSNTSLTHKRQHRKLSNRLRIIFLSRISEKKNLVFLLNLLSRIKSNIILDIYGPIEDLKYWERCKNIIAILPDNVQCNYIDTVSKDKVSGTFSHYDLFVFPTEGENFGHVISESLSAGTPVLVSDQTPWRDTGDGVITVASLTDSFSWLEAINKHCQFDFKEDKSLRNRVKKYFAKYYQSSNNTIDDYRLVLQGIKDQVVN